MSYKPPAVSGNTVGQIFISYKHLDFIEELAAQVYILESGIKDIGRAVYDIAKGKIQTKPLDDNPVILNALRGII